MASEASIEVMRGDGVCRLKIGGAWSLQALQGLPAQLGALPAHLDGAVDCDWSAAQRVDIGAAWVLIERLRARGATRITHSGNPPDTLELLESLRERGGAEAPMSQDEGWALERSVVSLGRWSVLQGEKAREAVEFFGRMVMVLGSAPRRVKALRLNSVARFIYETGITAIPIVALIAFLMAVIIAYLAASQLRTYGAGIYVVDLITVGVLRELGVLLTAIIVAGRTGSAFAAELGSMQLNEEVDALDATGVDWMETLVLPRAVGLVIALPLLTVIADLIGMAGGALLCQTLLDMPLQQFINRANEAIAPTTFWAGLIKAPVFALLIASAGTYRGLQVRGSSRELGRLTTVAVVQSIFLVLLADALFAVFYMKIDF